MSVTISDARELVDTLIGVAAHLEAEAEEGLDEHRITRTSLLVLAALDAADDGRMGQGELVARVRRTSGTMSVRLRRLEHAGMIERERDPESRRSVTVTLTDRGRALLHAALPAYDQRCVQLSAALSDGARESLAEHLSAWLAFFEPGERVAPRLGVAVAPSAVAGRMRRAVGLEPEPGVLVLRVGSDTAAAAAGLRRGDLIVEADGEPVRTVGDLDRAVRSASGPLQIRTLRGAEPRDATVELG